MSVREQLPQEFVSSMRTQLGEEIEDFLDCYEKEGWAGIRLNTSKISVQDAKEKLPFLLRSIPWTENGFYVEKKTKISENPFYYAGLYYIQE
ncbi:MAG: SAM-dependent methyltransferase, partial [Lachnospiraceae bacterium]|nr:SAM-dependent methyltransferase [Lachnospiraceae bacterium]